MRKIIFHFFAFIVGFLAVWLGLSQINWVEIVKVEEKTSKLEESLGNFYLNLIRNTNPESSDTTAVRLLEDIKKRICKANGIDPKTIHLHLVRSSDVNAFALPGNHIVILSDLLVFCERPEEVAGVMAHEMVHIEKNHIMKKLGKEIGFATLSGMLNSGTGGAETLKILTSTAYDRKMEEEADRIGVEYLQKSKIDPSALADFMYRLSMSEGDLQKHLTIISTHPQTEERAHSILDLMREKTVEYEPVLSDSDWEYLQNI